MIIMIAGATASGKSSLAALVAKLVDGEVVSADSMQVYKKMDIGTAKIKPSEMCHIPHHLLSIIDPNQPFSVAEYVDYAEKAIADIQSRNKTVIVTGGTGLYLRALIYPFLFGNCAPNEELRAQLLEESEKFGKDYVHQKLAELSPEKAQEIHPNNLKRVIRAIEILSYDNNAKIAQEEMVPKRDCCYFVLKVDRETLYNRINARVDKMIESGLEKEVRSLLESGLDFKMQSMQAIGYKEWQNYFLGQATLDETIVEIKTHSRNYAKRQDVWFKNEKGVIPLNTAESEDILANKILNYYEKACK